MPDLQADDAAVLAARAAYDAALVDQAARINDVNAAQAAKVAADEVVATVTVNLNTAIDAAEADLEHFRPGQPTPTATAVADATPPISDTVTI